MPRGVTVVSGERSFISGGRFWPVLRLRPRQPQSEMQIGAGIVTGNGSFVVRCRPPEVPYAIPCLIRETGSQESILKN